MAKAKSAKKAITNKAKPAKKPVAAKKVIKKPVKKPVVQVKKAAPVKTQKVVTEVKKEKLPKKVIPATAKKPVEEKINAKANDKVAVKAPKVDAKVKAKTKKPEKKADEDFDDDIIGDDFGESEIAEYEEDLKAVEDENDDSTLKIVNDEDSEVKDEEIYLTDSEGRRLCRVRDCDQVSTVEGYCRYHYLLLWKKIQIRKHILIDGKLEKYVVDLMARYPDKFLEVIKKDLKTEKDFLSVIQELEIDESAIAENDGEDEVQSFADEIRGIGEAPSMEDDSDF
jgi:hypothetical protein